MPLLQWHHRGAEMALYNATEGGIHPISSIGYFHIDISELRHEGGKGFLFVAVDRTSKPGFARIYRKATKLAAAAFLRVLVKTVPYKIHTILTGNGVQFTDRYQSDGRGCWSRGDRVWRAGARYHFEEP